MNHLNARKAGVVLGTFAALMHLIWAAFVALGWAQAIIDFKLWAHMISAPITISPFDFSAAITGIIVAAVVGWIVGHIFAHVWNRAHR